jgi:hypothetical protein
MADKKKQEPQAEGEKKPGSYWGAMRKNLGTVAATASADVAAKSAEGVSTEAVAESAGVGDETPVQEDEKVEPEPETEQVDAEDEEEEEETFFSLKRLSNVLEMASSLLADLGEDDRTLRRTRQTIGDHSCSFEVPTSRHANTYSRPMPNSKEIADQWGLKQSGSDRADGGSSSGSSATPVVMGTIDENSTAPDGDSADAEADDDESFFSMKRLSQAMFTDSPAIPAVPPEVEPGSQPSVVAATETASDSAGAATVGDEAVAEHSVGNPETNEGEQTAEDEEGDFSVFRKLSTMFGAEAVPEPAVAEAEEAQPVEGQVGGLEGNLARTLLNPSPPLSKWKRRVCRSPTFHLPNCRHSQNYYRPLPNSYEIAEQRAAEVEAAEIDRIAMQAGDGSPNQHAHGQDDDDDFLSLRKLSMMVGMGVDDTGTAAAAAPPVEAAEDSGDGGEGEGEDDEGEGLNSTAEGVMNEEELHQMRQREGSTASMHHAVEGEAEANLTLTSSLRRLTMMMGLAPERHASSTSPLPFEGASMASLRLSLAECVELLVQRRAEVETCEKVMVQKLLDVGFDERDALATVQIKLAEATNSGLSAESFE